MKKSIAIVNYIAIFLLIALFVVMNCLAGRYSNHITLYLHGFGIDYGSEEYIQSKAEAEELAKEIAGEGIVLLKNENGALPLSQPTINVFGWGGCDNGFIYMGFGSGSTSTYGQVGLYEGLRSAGFELNEDLVEAYNGVKFRRDTGWAAASWKLNEPNEILTESRMKSAEAFSDTAMIVLSRFGMEGHDLPKYQNNASGADTKNGRHYLELTESEEALIENVTKRFEKVIVVINSANIMEMGFLENEKIDAALDIFFPGNVGSYGLGQILTGEVVPSGHLADTAAYDLTTAATYANSSTGGTNNYSGVPNGKYIDYAENIYTGYYWYETAEKEGFWDSEYAKNKWKIKDGYDDVVQYPFGYGLSYANFDWTIESVSVPASSELKEDSLVTFTVSVKNNAASDFAGQDVVQLYYSAPYTVGGIEKPAIKLGAFAKTSVLDPGKSERLTLSVPVRDMASYDCYDKNNNGFMGYEAEAGKYTFTLRTDVRSIASNTSGGSTFEYTVPAGGFKYDKDEVTKAPVKNLFTTYTNQLSGASSTYFEKSLSAESYAYSIDGSDSNQNIRYMTRGDFTGSFPLASVARAASKEFYDKSYDNSGKMMIDASDEAPVTDSDATHYTLDDMYITGADGKITGLTDYGDPKWDDLVSQLSVDQIAELCGNGGLHTIEIKEINKPLTVDTDGPSGFNTTIFGSDQYGGYAASYPCEALMASTWNWKLAYRMGCSVGNEGEAAKIDGWYGPACNLHRTPFGGRNYEYYSEDPYLSGVMSAYTTLGAKDKGLYAYVKHFAANDTEITRAGGYTWLSEQAFRENYLKPFEITVKDGGAIGMMSAYNRIGSTRTSGSYNLLTALLRDEWGFEGSVISDYNNNIPVLCPDEAIRAGNDLMMEASGGKGMFKDRSSATAIKALHKGAKNILYTYTAAQYSMATSQELDLSGLNNAAKTTAIFPWWIVILVIADVIAAVGAVFWFIMILKKSAKPSEVSAQ